MVSVVWNVKNELKGIKTKFMTRNDSKAYTSSVVLALLPTLKQKLESANQNTTHQLPPTHYKLRGNIQFSGITPTYTHNMGITMFCPNILVDWETCTLREHKSYLLNSQVCFFFVSTIRLDFTKQFRGHFYLKQNR